MLYILDGWSFKMLYILGSSLVAHLAAGAATRVPGILPNIVNKVKQGESGPSLTLGTIKVIKNKNK